MSRRSVWPMIAIIAAGIAADVPLASAQTGVCTKDAADVVTTGNELMKKISADTSIPLDRRNKLRTYQNCIKNHFYNLMRNTKSTTECADLKEQYTELSATPATGNHRCQLP